MAALTVAYSDWASSRCGCPGPPSSSSSSVAAPQHKGEKETLNTSSVCTAYHQIVIKLVIHITPFILNILQISSMNVSLPSYLYFIATAMSLADLAALAVRAGLSTKGLVDKRSRLENCHFNSSQNSSDHRQSFQSENQPQF